MSEEDKSLTIGIVATVVLVPVSFLMIWIAIESFKEAREFGKHPYFTEGMMACGVAWTAIIPVIMFWLNF